MLFSVPFPIELAVSLTVPSQLRIWWIVLTPAVPVFHGVVYKESHFAV